MATPQTIVILDGAGRKVKVDAEHPFPVTSIPAAPLSSVTGTIVNAQSLSGAIDLRSVGTPVAIQTDAAWDTNTVTFQGSYDGVVYTNLRSMGTEIALPGVVASSMEAVDLHYFLGCRYLKVRSGTAAAPVAQVGNTTVTVICGRIWTE